MKFWHDFYISKKCYRFWYGCMWWKNILPILKLLLKRSTRRQRANRWNSQNSNHSKKRLKGQPGRKYQKLNTYEPVSYNTCAQTVTIRKDKNSEKLLRFGLKKKTYQLAGISGFNTVFCRNFSKIWRKIEKRLYLYIIYNRCPLIGTK